MQGMLPAQQRLHARHVVTFDIDDRLIVNVELLLLDGGTQARFDGDALLQLAVHAGAEELKVISAAILRLIHGGVGVAQQLADIRAIAWIQADTDTHRGDERAAIHDHGRAERFVDPTGSFVDVVRALHVLEHDDELVAAHAHDDVLIAHRGANARRDCLQQLVAGLVTARVVDVLEAIQIEKHHRQRGTRAARLVDRLGQVSRQKQPIRQAGELVVVREMIQMLLFLEKLRLDLPAQRDVVCGEREDGLAVDLKTTATDLHVRQRAVLAALTDAEGQTRVRIAQARQQAFRLRGVVSENLADRHAPQLAEAISETALQSGVTGDDAQRGGIRNEHAVGRLLDQRVIVASCHCGQTPCRSHMERKQRQRCAHDANCAGEPVNETGGVQRLVHTRAQTRRALRLPGIANATWRTLPEDEVPSVSRTAPHSERAPRTNQIQTYVGSAAFLREIEGRNALTHRGPPSKSHLGAEVLSRRRRLPRSRRR
jgi:hypothetical protein